MSETFPQVQAWLASANHGTDPEAADRMADIIMDGLSAVPGGVSKMNTRLLVLLKIMAMVLALLPEDAEGDRLLRNFAGDLGGALQAEVFHFRQRFQRDMRKKRRAR